MEKSHNSEELNESFDPINQSLDLSCESTILARPVVSLSRRGPKTYATCPPCKSSWSLRERLYDLRSGKPCDLETLVCPTCRAPIALPEELDVKTIR